MMIFQKNLGSGRYVEISDITLPDNYEEEMLIRCSFRYVLPTEIREIDTDKNLLVRVDGLVPLEVRCRRINPDMKMIKKLLQDLVDCFSEIKEYMLSPEGILLGMNSVYYSEETDEFRFIYVPGNKAGFRKQIKNLFEDIMRIYDHKDSEGVVYLYDMYSRFLNENFTPDMLKKLVNSENKTYRSDHVPPKPKPEPVINYYPYTKETIAGNPSVEKEETEPEKMRIDKTMYVLMYVAVVVVALVMLIFFGISSLRFSVLALICVTVYTVVDYMHKKNDFDMDISMKKANENEFEVHEIRPEKESETYINIHDERDVLKTTPSISCEVKEPPKVSGNIVSRNIVLGNSVPGTTVLTPVGKEIVSRLVPRSADSGLDQIYVIEGETRLGRQDSTCDYVLDEPSVSRLHAVLDKHGDIVTLTDMGSTNGTYINEDRISEGEVRVLNPGDLISIANVSYECV